VSGQIKPDAFETQNIGGKGIDKDRTTLGAHFYLSG
jgi:hypothetical protein